MKEVESVLRWGMGLGQDEDEQELGAWGKAGMKNEE